MKDQLLNDVLTTIGQNVYTLRQKENEKLTTVAKSVGVTHSVISKIENSNYESLNLKLLVQIANHFNVPLNTILSQNNISQ
jgi:transcriptional regulator with XRE-family HTH domain